MPDRPIPREPSTDRRPDRSPAVVFDDVSFAFDDNQVLDHVSFEMPTGGMRFLLGASGAGKSVMLKLILGLMRPDAGRIVVNGQRIDQLRERDLLPLRANIGMVFQENALFDSLTVDENVGYRLYEETDLPVPEARARVMEVLGFIGLAEYTSRLPSELSGGQRRRVGLARALASRPGLLLFDDPTTGLDPITAATVDDEVVKLRDLERVTIDRGHPPDAGRVLRRDPRSPARRRHRAGRRSRRSGRHQSRFHGAARRAHPLRGARVGTARVGRPVPHAVPVQDAAALVTRGPRKP